MPRIRSIHPDACTSEKLAQVSGDAERCYWRLQTHCDDAGRCEDHSRLIWAALFPLHEDIGPQQVDGWLTELERAGLLVRYLADERRYVSVTQWDRFQHPQRPKPSTIPAPSDTPPVAVHDVSATCPVHALPGVGEGEGVGGEPETNGASAVPDVKDERVAPLVAGFVDDYRAERTGHDPPRNWRAAAGAAIKRALKDGESVPDIALCLGVIAHESKQPSTLPYVLADFHANRERRVP